MRNLRISLLTAAVVTLVACKPGPAATPAAPSVPEAPQPVAASGEPPPAVASAAAPVVPSFDCAKAEGRAQTLVCDDPVLATLDNELARLFALASSDKSLDAARRRELVAMQRGWVKGRDDCWKSDDLRNCVLSDYANRIHELREGHANARSADAAGISEGPTAWRCEGLDALISATFIRTDMQAGRQPGSGVVNLRWLDQAVALEAKPSASGARYVGSAYDGVYEFWNKGDEAMFTRPGKPAGNCKVEPIG